MISLRLLNAHVDYDSHFPPEYEAGHTAGLRLLRVVDAVSTDHGPDTVASLYAGLGARIFEADPLPADLDDRGSTSGEPGGSCSRCWPGRAAGDLADGLEDESHDAAISASTDEALALTGKDVGTPIIHFRPPEGVAFFGPVISRLPAEQDAVRLWDHVVGLAEFPGFAELKRSLREPPQLRGLGLSEDKVGPEQDWHGGSRRRRSNARRPRGSGPDAATGRPRRLGRAVLVCENESLQRKARHDLPAQPLHHLRRQRAPGDGVLPVRTRR